MAFTAGVLIALAFFDLLPKILSLADSQALVGSALIMVVSGFVFLFGMNQYFFKHKYTKGSEKEAVSPSSGLLATFEFCTHAFLEGLAIG